MRRGSHCRIGPMSPAFRPLVTALALLTTLAACGQQGSASSSSSASRDGSLAPSLGLRLPTGVRLDPAAPTSDVGPLPLTMRRSPDGKRLVLSLGGYSEQGVQVLDAATGRVVQNLPQAAAFVGLAFSPDGRVLYSSGGNQDVVYRYDWSAGDSDAARQSRARGESAARGGQALPRRPRRVARRLDALRRRESRRLARGHRRRIGQSGAAIRYRAVPVRRRRRRARRRVRVGVGRKQRIDLHAGGATAVSRRLDGSTWPGIRRRSRSTRRGRGCSSRPAARIRWRWSTPKRARSSRGCSIRRRPARTRARRRTLKAFRPTARASSSPRATRTPSRCSISRRRRPTWRRRPGATRSPGASQSAGIPPR